MGISIENDDNRDKRASNIDLARQQMEANRLARLQRESNNNVSSSGNDDFTNNRKDSSLVEKSVQKDQELAPESYSDDKGGSISGGYNAGSTITSNTGSGDSSTDHGGGGSGSSGRKGDVFRIDSDKLPKGKVKENISLFGD